MSNAPKYPQSEFYGYLLFDEPDWWHDFNITKKCARYIEEFRHAVIPLQSWNGEDAHAYEATIRQLWETSEHVVNHMQWHTKRNIAVLIALAELYEECTDWITPLSFRTEFIRYNLNIKAMCIRSSIARMHDVHCCND